MEWQRQKAHTNTHTRALTRRTNWENERREKTTVKRSVRSTQRERERVMGSYQKKLSIWVYLHSRISIVFSRQASRKTRIDFLSNHSIEIHWTTHNNPTVAAHTRPHSFIHSFMKYTHFMQRNNIFFWQWRWRRLWFCFWFLHLLSATFL